MRFFYPIWLIILMFVPMDNKTMAQTCSWITASPSSHVQAEGNAAVVNNRMYVFLGFGCNPQNVCGTQLTQIIEEFNPRAGANGQWRSRASMPLRVNHVDVVAVDNEIWCIGGFKGNHGGPPTDTVQIYTPATNTWRYGPRLPAKHASGGSVYVGRKIYVFGGLMPDRRSVTGAHYMYDLDQPALGWQTRATMPNPRNHMGHAVVRGRVYAVGGQIGHDCCTQDRNNVDIYDPYTNTWSSTTALPQPISHMECGTFSMDGMIYMVAGNTNTYTTNRWIYRFNSYTNSWSRLCDLPINLWNPAAEIIGDSLIVAHGGQYTYTAPSAVTRMYNPGRVKKYDLGFWPKTVNIQLNTNQTAQREVNLHTVTGETFYTLNTASRPSWLATVSTSHNKLTPTGSAVKLNFNTSGWAPAQYQFMLIARSAVGSPINYRADTLRINLTVNQGAVLSIEQLPHFVVKQVRPGKALLQWATDKIRPGGHFVIQRSFGYDSVFSDLAVVNKDPKPATEGIYTYEDLIGTTAARAVHYRIKETDTNGHTTFSQIETLLIEQNRIHFEVYPNPANDVLHMNLQAPQLQQAKLRLINMHGAVVWQGNFPENSQISIGNIAEGYYMLEAQTPTGVAAAKVAIQR